MSYDVEISTSVAVMQCLWKEKFAQNYKFKQWLATSITSSRFAVLFYITN